MKNPVVVGGALGSAFVALIMAFLVMANSLGWFTLASEQLDTIQTFVIALVALVAIAVPLVTAFFVKSKVTSVANPKVNGEPAALVPLEQLRAMQATAPQQAPNKEGI